MSKTFNRLEVIDWTNDGSGREFVKWTETDFTIQEEEQDNGRTLKIFITEPLEVKNAHLVIEERIAELEKDNK